MRYVLGAILCSALLLTGCSSLEGTGDKGFVSGAGTVTVVKAVDRGSPVELTGEDLEGEPLDIADLRGKPVVVVVWGSWCGPCIAEAPDVVEAAQELEGQARFVGIDLRDASTAEALAHERKYDVPYPSFYSPDGEAMLSFPGALGPRTIPAFVVLDADGRIAGSIIGELPSVRTLVDLVEESAGGTARG
jgi:thiol-disulfide isomerase/thioredoxin